MKEKKKAVVVDKEFENLEKLFLIYSQLSTQGKFALQAGASLLLMSQEGKQETKSNETAVKAG